MIIMKQLSFEWDENKNRSNVKKHGISFMEAATVFFDELAIVFDNPEHSFQEDRFLIIGLSSYGKLYVVIHCERSENVIRIISARKASKAEAKIYQKHMI